MKRLKMIHLLKTSCVALALCGFTSARAGVVSGGGADYSLGMKAWFTSADLNKTVKACVQIDPAFGFEKAALEKLTRDAFKTWASYYDTLGGKQRETDPKAWNACMIDGVVRRGMRIATTLQLNDQCDGSEDLTVFFGEENALTIERKSKYNFPFGFSELNDNIPMAIHQDAWSKGFIWIAKPKSVNPTFSIPLWSNFGGSPLKMIILHEMGHVFGNPHIKGTVMDDEIGKDLAEKTDINHSMTTAGQFDQTLLQIDHTRILGFEPELAYSVPMSPKSVNCSPYDDDCIGRNKPYFQYAFQSLTGLDLQSERFTASFSKLGFPIPLSRGSQVSVLQLLQSELDVKADGSEWKMKFTPISILGTSTGGDIFQEGCSRDLPLSSQGISVFGELETPTGKKAMELSINQGLGRIELIDPNEPADSPSCKFYTDHRMACVLLAVDFDALKTK